MEKLYQLVEEIREKQETLENEEAKQFVLDNVVLPEFYTFKEPPTVYEINTQLNASGGVTIHVSDKEGKPVGGTFGDIENAYDFVTSDLEGKAYFTGDLSVYGKSPFSESITVPSKTKDGEIRKGYTRWLSGYRANSEEYMAKSDYLEFLTLSIAYDENPENFGVAYNWLNMHPAFWTTDSKYPHYWSIRNNHKIDVSVSIETGNVYLEYGAAVEPQRLTHYHDFRLDVSASSYEEAIIELAKLVHKFFDSTGQEIEGVEYEKSELEVTLEKALANLDDAED